MKTDSNNGNAVVVAVFAVAQTGGCRESARKRATSAARLSGAARRVAAMAS